MRGCWCAHPYFDRSCCHSQRSGTTVMGIRRQRPCSWWRDNAVHRGSHHTRTQRTTRFALSVGLPRQALTRSGNERAQGQKIAQETQHPFLSVEPQRMTTDHERHLLTLGHTSSERLVSHWSVGVCRSVQSGGRGCLSPEMQSPSGGMGNGALHG